MLSDNKKENLRLFESLDMFTLALLDVDPVSLISEVASVFGQDVAMRLVDLFGGSVVRVPTKEAVKDAVVRACIWRDHNAGVGIDQICESYGMRSKAVYAIIDRFKVLSEAAGKVGNVFQ